jgi:hypothetical protein
MGDKSQQVQPFQPYIRASFLRTRLPDELACYVFGYYKEEPLIDLLQLDG